MGVLADKFVLADSQQKEVYLDRRTLNIGLKSQYIPFDGLTGDATVKLVGLKPKTIEVFGDTASTHMVRQDDNTYAAVGNSSAVDNGDDVDVTIPVTDATDGSQGCIRISWL